MKRMDRLQTKKNAVIAPPVSRIDWPDLRRVVWRNGWPLVVVLTIFWWVGPELVVKFYAMGLFVCAGICLPFAIVRLLTNGR